MAFYSYEGISDEVLDKVHTTSTGETYTLRHNDCKFRSTGVPIPLSAA